MIAATRGTGATRASGSIGPFPRLHVVTDTRRGRGVVETVQAVLDAGRPAIQVRVKDVSDREHLDVATAVVRICRAAGALCLINDRVDIALASGADGVHLGAHDLPVREVRRLVGDGFVIGGTARDPQTARALVAEGADYLGVGPVHATTTKTGLPDPLGTDRLAQVVAAVDVPVIAIGGITRPRLPAVLTAGAHGAAVVGAVADAIDPAEVTRSLLAVLAAEEAERDEARDEVGRAEVRDEVGRAEVRDEVGRAEVRDGVGRAQAADGASAEAGA